MAEKEVVETSEAQIAVHWKEEDMVYPSPKFIAQANMVVGHDFDGTATIVTAQDPKNPESGRIELMFTSDPVELRKWVIHDNAGSRTTVLLGPLTEGGTLDSNVFSNKARIGSSNR